MRKIERGNMKNKEDFFQAIYSLLFSMSDTPKEIVWTVNDLLDFYEKETGEVLNFRIDEDEELNEQTYNEICKMAGM